MNKEARTILNKKYAMALIEKNHKLIDVQPSRKIPGEVAFVFEKTESLEEEFNILVNSERVLKNMYGLTFKDIRTLIGVLQGYIIEDEERFSIMEKLQIIDDLITGYKTPVLSAEPEVVLDEKSVIDVSELEIKMMNGGK